MRRFPLLRRAGSVCLALAVSAFISSNPDLHGQASQPAYRTVDGGADQILQSIFIPPLPHSPFSLLLETETSRPLANGGSVTLVNKRRIARDRAGRIYQERWILMPKGSKLPSKMNLIQITDPAAHTWWNCETEIKQCQVLPYGLTTTQVYQPLVQVSGELANGAGTHLHEDLGKSFLNGIETTGYRESTTLNPGTAGNDLPLVIVREFWYSRLLGINLLSKVDDPLSGRQTFTVTGLSTSEPEPQIFDLPSGYTVVDERKNAPHR